MDYICVVHQRHEADSYVRSTEIMENSLKNWKNMECLQDHKNLAHPECDNDRCLENKAFSVKPKSLHKHFEPITRLE